MKQTTGNIDFILFGEGNYNTLGVLHCMAERGIEVFLLVVGSGKQCLQGNIIEYSRFANYGHNVQTEKEGVEWILANKMLFPEGTVIYPTSDTTESLLDIHYDNLIKHYNFPNCGYQGAVTLLMEKDEQISKARSFNVRVLKSLYTHNSNFDHNSVVYPCMVKPLKSITGSKGDMKVCNSRKELDEALSSAKNTSEFIVQQYINNEADLLFLGIALPNEDIWMPSLVKKPGVSPTGEYTNAIVTTAVAEHLPELKDVKHFIASLHYVGPFSIEFGLEKGKNYFFEINLRNDGTSHYPLASGVNIPYVYYRACKGELTLDDMNYEQGEFPMIDEVLDIRRILSREISFSKWWHFFRTAKAYRYYTTSDKRIAIALIPMFVSRLCSKIWRAISSIHPTSSRIRGLFAK